MLRGCEVVKIMRENGEGGRQLGESGSLRGSQTGRRAGECLGNEEGGKGWERERGREREKEGKGESEREDVKVEKNREREHMCVQN